MGMEVIKTKTIMTKADQGNRWFGIDYHMNLYKGCPMGCIYCDSRCESYHIDNFDEVRIKENALEMVGLDPKGYLNKKIYTLSGGEQQRVALARLFLKPCSIILADEPTGSLDVKNRDVVLEILRKMNEHGKTVIVVTHDPYVLTVCDRVIKI